MSDATPALAPQTAVRPLSSTPSRPAPSPSHAAAEPLLQVEDLTAGYGDLPAIRGVTLNLAPGEIVALFGANGAGKTTTLLATVGVLPRMRGTVRWRGKPVKQPLHKLSRDGLAFVPEERSVIGGLSTKDNLQLGRGGVDAAVSYFPELEPLLNRPAGLLSGGQQQMLTLARAMAGKPAAVLVDELSLGLAPLVVERLLGALRDSADRDGLSVLLVEQQARRAMTVVDRWYLLRNGTIGDTGKASDGMAHLEAAYISGVIGATQTQSEQGTDL